MTPRDRLLRCTLWFVAAALGTLLACSRSGDGGAPSSGRAEPATEEGDAPPVVAETDRVERSTEDFAHAMIALALSTLRGEHDALESALAATVQATPPLLDGLPGAWAESTDPMFAVAELPLGETRSFPRGEVVRAITTWLAE